MKNSKIQKRNTKTKVNIAKEKISTSKAAILTVNKELLFIHGIQEDYISYMIDQFLGHVKAFHWNDNYDCIRCLYCNCPCGKNICSYPFVCEIYYNYEYDRTKIIDHRNYELVSMYYTFLTSNELDVSDEDSIHNILGSEVDDCNGVIMILNKVHKLFLTELNTENRFDPTLITDLICNRLIHLLIYSEYYP